MKQKIDTPDSSNISSLEYDKETQILQITFKKGGVYQYNKVPSEVFNMIAQADSVGSAFHTLIKSGGYSYEKIGDNTDTMSI